MRISKMSTQVQICSVLLSALGATLFLGTTIASQPADAHSVTYNLDIPAQNLNDALQAFALASQHKLLYSSELVDGKRSPALKGQYTTEQAVKALLSGTRLDYEVTRDGLVLIRTEDLPPRTGNAPAVSDDSSGGDLSAQEGKKSSSSRFFTAQVDQGKASSAVSVGNQTSNSQEIPNSGSSTGLTEIIVTAQKRSERAQDVPISLVAVLAEELERRNVTSLDDLPAVVPGLAVDDAGQLRQITLRGVSNTVGSGSLVGLYVDEADVTAGSTSQLDLNTYDLQRVEVLRGPQGTLYGEGSAGGAIRLITNSPVLNQFQMKADVAELFTDGGAPSERIQEVVNVPLIDNQLGLRVAGAFDREGGWINQPAANATNINDQNIADVRAKVLWQPINDFQVNAMTEIHRNSLVPSVSEDANGNYTQVFNLTTTPRVQDNYDLYNLTESYDLPVARIVSSTTYFTQNNNVFNNGTFLQLLPPPNAPFNYFGPSYYKKYSSRSEELRMSSTDAGPWQWTVGGFFRGYRDNLDAPTSYFGPPIAAGSPLPSPGAPYLSSGASNAWSVFADLNYKILDRLTIGAGLRGYHDQEASYGVLQEAAFRSVDPRFYADLKLTDKVNIYASAAKGFRSGGFNSPGVPAYDPEVVWTYELGIKTGSLPGNVSLNGALFYTDYKNYIVAGIPVSDVQAVGFLSNAGNAVIKGAELTATWQPIDQLTLSANGAYYDGYFSKVNVVPGSSAYLPGDPVDGIYKYQDTFSVERDFRWTGHGGFARLDYSLQGRSTFRDRTVGPWYYSESDVIHMLNAEASLQWNDQLSFGLFAQNLLDDRGYTTANVVESNADRARPRTIGLKFSVKY